MPAQRRSLPYPSPPPPPPPPTSEDEEDDPQNQDDDDDDDDEEEEEVQETEGAEEEQNQDDDADEEDGGDASEYDEFITVKLADLRKEVQCPICLGIIRKTRTVMECLHRFCRECIDKSMRLGNNECPACRTHCASRRSLRDDPNFDALIAALYSDIDEYEKEEFDLLEEEKNHNEKIQASIAETFQRQSEALGKRKSTATPTTAAFARKSQGSHRSFSLGQRGRGRSRDLDMSLAGSEDDEEEDANGNGVIEYSSSDEPSPDRRQNRPRRSATRSSVAHIPGNVGITHEKKSNVVETKRDNRGTSPLQIGNGEILSWGGGGVRSQTRHGNSGSSGRLVKGGRTTKLVEYFSGLGKNDNEFDMHLALLPMDEQSAAKLQRPYICCWPSLSIRHLCQFIALQTSVREEEVEILTRKPRTLLTNAEFNPSEELRVVGRQESMVELRHSCTNTRGDLVFVYRFKKPN